jgi:hypothetical protein
MRVHPLFDASKLAVAAFGTCLAFLASTASAAVLYTQLPLDDGDSYYANPNIGQQLADDFTLGGAVSLQSITWWGGYDGDFDAGDDDFRVRVYDSIGDTGAVLAQFNIGLMTPTVTSILDSVGNAIYQYDFSLPSSLALASGTYYLFVENLGSSDWLWQTTGPGNDSVWGRGQEGDPWTKFTSSDQDYLGDLAFRLEGERVQVPEPASLALFGIASLSMLLAGRRRERLDA